jgi:diguanylate cyclase (GGDEF)-like protein
MNANVNDSYELQEVLGFLNNIFSSSLRSLEGFFESSLTEILLLTGGSCGFISIWDPQSRAYKLKYAPKEFSQECPCQISLEESEQSFIGSIKNAVLSADLQSGGLDLSFIFGSSKLLPRSAIVAPLRFQGKNFGTLAVVSQKENAFSQGKLELLDLTAKVLSVFIENYNQAQENRNRIQQMKTLIDSSRQINSFLFADEAVKSVVHSAKELLNLDKVMIFLLEDNRLLPFEFQEGKQTRMLVKLGEIFNTALREIMEQRKPFIYTNVPRDFLKEYSLSGVALLPLLYQEKKLGFLTILLPEKRTLLPEELMVAQSLANQCAVALMNARLFAETQQKADEFSSLFEVAQSLTGSLQAEEIVSKVLDSAQRLVRADESVIFEIVPGSDEMRCLAALSPYEEQFKSSVIKVGEGITGWVARTGVGENLPEAELDPRVKHLDGTPVEEESLISMPLKIKEEIIGVMTVYRLGRRPFSENDFRLITIFSSFAASAIYNARLFQNISEMAITDYLTGLYNYRYFFRRLEEELAFAQRHDQKLVLVYLDLNQFKKYNDLYGHREGDKVLAKFAKVLKENVRLSDVVFRYGGEEFVIILPSTDAPEAEQIIERLNHKISEGFPPDLQVPISASIGCAVFPTDATDGETLLRIADSRMYSQKDYKKTLSV